MKVLFLSDTHGQHHKLPTLPPADLIIHGGDLTMHGGDHEVENFFRWFASLEYTHKIFIAGNHDFFFENESIKRIQKMLPKNIHYLYGSSVTINGVHFWGSPLPPTECHWATNENTGKQDYFKHIPSSVDVLITHGPPHGILDLSEAGFHTGNHDLFKSVQKKKPAFHLFGHCHESYGTQQINGTIFINGSILDAYYQITNQAIVFEV